MGNQDLQTVTTGKVRLSFVHLFTPYASKPGQEPKYSTTMLIPKSDYATKQKIDMAINAAIQQGVNEKFNGVRPPVLAVPIHDGDGARPSDGMPFGEECRGHWVLTGSSKQQVEIVDLNLNRILNQSEVYSGMYARVNIRFFPFVNSGKKGVGCGLGAVQKIEDGEPLGGRVSAAEAFGENSFAPGYQQGYNPAVPPNYNPAVPPNYNPAVPVYPQQQPAPTPGYGAAPMQPQMYPQPQQQMYPQQQIYPQQPVQYDPITGKPLNGGVMGI